jgi:flagellum-specific peptidoglycan hydrolase FlgJ
LQTDGYATDPNYSSTLIATIEQFNLSQYDWPITYHLQI